MTQDMVTASFKEAFVIPIVPDEKMLASTLLYKVSFDCSNQYSADLVTKDKPRFIAILRRLHMCKTGGRMDDLLVEESTGKQAL